MRLEARYWVNKRKLTIEEGIYIAPDENDHEWSTLVKTEWDADLGKYTDKHIKQYNGINPSTKERTGEYYNEENLFKTVSWARNALREHIKGLIRENRKEIERLEGENSSLTEKLITI